jgi:hypothetical protein
MFLFVLYSQVCFICRCGCIHYSPLGSSGPLNGRRKGTSPPEVTVPSLSWPGVRPNEKLAPPTTSNFLPIIITAAVRRKHSSPPLALFGVENAYPHQQMDVAVLTGQQ